MIDSRCYTQALLRNLRAAHDELQDAHKELRHRSEARSSELQAELKTKHFEVTRLKVRGTSGRFYVRTLGTYI